MFACTRGDNGGDDVDLGLGLVAGVTSAALNGAVPDWLAMISID